MPRSRSRSPRRERRRSRSRERRRHRRSRSRSPRHRSRSPRHRSKERHRSRSPRHKDKKDRHEEKSKSRSSDTYGRPDISKEDLIGMEEDEAEMMKAMGFASFDSTKGKKVEGNDVYVTNTLRKRRYRQYMNRRGGFNRPLDFIA